MTYKVVRLLRNKKTDQLFEQKYFKKTSFHRFTENDYIELGILLHYYFDVENKPTAMDINVNTHNALEIFTTKAQTYITKDGGNEIKLEYFDGNHKDVSNYNFVKKIDKWKQLDLDKLGKYRRNIGHLTENLLYLNHIKDNIIDLQVFFKELAIEHDLSEDDILYKNEKRFQMWRNRIINDTVNNFEFSTINKNFLSFIILHLFILCHDEFNILEFEYVDNGKTQINKLLDIVNSKIKQVKNKIKKKSMSRRKKSTSRKRRKSSSRRRR